MEKLKQSYKNNGFKISGPPWNLKFELSDESYSITDLKNNFEYVIQKHETLTMHPQKYGIEYRI